jgi:hypothetical protein
MRGRRVGLLTVVVLVVAAVAGASVAGFVTHRWRDPSPVTQAQLRAAVVRYEVARAPIWPENMIGRPLTLADRDRLQAEHADRLARTAVDPVLSEELAWDFADYLRTQSDGGLNVWTSVKCATVLWRVLHREFDGDIVVEAGVSFSPTAGRWSDGVGRLVDVRDYTYVTAPVSLYTLKQVEGRWLVEKVDGSPRDYDLETGERGVG